SIASSGPNQKNDGELGINVAKMTPQIARRFNIRKDIGGIVSDVKPESKADKAEIINGDIIIEINRKEINSLRAFNRAVHKVKKGGMVSFLIQRMHTGLIVIHIKK
ncbi:MAG: PDZ domain-containing protein, partial [Desulfosarcina sp.]|nr:PDZ domain-containing protein [Desulfobacterales bacterium]